MAQMARLAEVMKTKILTTGSNSKNNAGFTLIELLVVILIVGILAGFVTLSINLAKPSAISRLKAAIQQHIAQVQNHVQLYNQPMRLVINKNKLQTLSFQPNFKPADPLDDQPTPVAVSLWQPSGAIAELPFKSVKVSASANTIEILPNGFITSATLTLSQDGQSITLKTNADKATNTNKD